MHPYFDLPLPITIAHRGCAGEAPENTLPSFERALAQDAAILESDLHLTRDGIPVLIHDPFIDRVTDGSGPVASYTLAELQRFDAAYRFRCDGGQSDLHRNQGVVIPSLEEAFAAFPQTRFNLELKASQPGLVEAVVERVAKCRREAITLLTASDEAIMDALRGRLESLPNPVAQGASTTDVLAFLRGADGGHPPHSGPMALQIPADYGGKPLVTSELIERAHQQELQVHVWTINEPVEMTRLLDLGVDGIVTDYPGRLVGLLRERATHR
jgi:glycerophosphoryl diester phosphodiesterase